MLTDLPRSSISGIQFPAIPDANAATLLALQYQLETTQWWSSDRLQAHQLEQLLPLLQHAASSVPYYQQRFNTPGLVIPENLDIDFFRSLPIATRSSVQQAGEQLQSQQVPTARGALQFSTTSGSTGRPVRFARTGVTQLLALAFAMRDHLWHARDFRGKLAAIRWFPRGTAEAPDGIRHADWGQIVAPIFSSGPSVVLNVIASLEQQLRWLQREQPDYLVSFPSNLMALAKYAASQGISLPATHIRTIGESVTDEARRVIQHAWQRPLVDIYTCEEAGYLAIQCPQSDHYHVQSENVLLEIVDEAGQPCAIGQTGQVLITTLHNYATPLIRYEIGDMAEFGEPCPCGRGLPVIRRIHGRKRNRLILPSGQNVFPYLGDHGEIAQATGARVHQFQCIQHSLEEIELKLVLDRPLDATQQACVARLMQGHLGHPFRVVFSFPADIPRGPTGKYEEFISKVAC